MPSVTAHAKVPAPAPSQESDRRLDPLAFADISDIPPPVPHIKPTREQLLRSLEIGIAQARAGLCVDFDVVQARMRAKYGVPSR